MAIAVQQIYPVAHLPLILGVLRRLEVATVIDRLHPAPPGACALVWAWGRSLGARHSGRAIMRSIRWGNGWKSGGWWRCCSRGSRGPRSMITG